MSIIPFILLAFGALGHIILWVALVNRAHGLGIRRRWVDLLTILCGLMLVALPFAVAAALASVLAPRMTLSIRLIYSAAWAYMVGCSVVCLAAALQRWRWRRHPERRGALVANHTSRIGVADRDARSLAAPGIPTWLSRLPGNQAFAICIHEKELAIPRLSVAVGPSSRDGLDDADPVPLGSLHLLRIVHLADLHMSGRITRAYFERVVEEVNCCQPDLVAITGDLIDRDECRDWIPATFGRLRAAGGVYYVLGNHDLRVDEARLKRALADAGLIHLGGAWREITIRDTPLILAGNELPWYGPAAEMSGCPVHDAAGLPLRILLAHTPDQFGWAQANDVDLMLAGHLHGGQVCLPLFGAITSPSLHGVRYAAGTFREGNTVMHVSRGTSALTPIRWNCPPEIAVLNLRSAT